MTSFSSERHNLYYLINTMTSVLESGQRTNGWKHRGIERVREELEAASIIAAYKMKSELRGLAFQVADLSPILRPLEADIHDIAPNAHAHTQLYDVYNPATNSLTREAWETKLVEGEKILVERLRDPTPLDIQEYPGAWIDDAHYFAEELHGRLGR